MSSMTLNSWTVAQHDLTKRCHDVATTWAGFLRTPEDASRRSNGRNLVSRRGLLPEVSRRHHFRKSRLESSNPVTHPIQLTSECRRAAAYQLPADWLPRSDSDTKPGW